MASGQFSPRVVRIFVRSRITKATFAVFLATFLLSLLVLTSYEQRAGPPPRHLGPAGAVWRDPADGGAESAAVRDVRELDAAADAGQSCDRPDRPGVLPGAGARCRWAPVRGRGSARGRRPDGRARGAGRGTAGREHRAAGAGGAAARGRAAADPADRGLRRAGDAGAGGARRGRRRRGGRCATRCRWGWSGPSTRISASGCASCRTSRCGRCRPAVNDPTTAVQCLDRIVQFLAAVARRPLGRVAAPGPAGHGAAGAAGAGVDGSGGSGVHRDPGVRGGQSAGHPAAAGRARRSAAARPARSGGQPLLRHRALLVQAVERHGPGARGPRVRPRGPTGRASAMTRTTAPGRLSPVAPAVLRNRAARSRHEVVVREVPGQPLSAGPSRHGAHQEFAADEGAAPGLAEAPAEFVAIPRERGLPWPTSKARICGASRSKVPGRPWTAWPPTRRWRRSSRPAAPPPWPPRRRCRGRRRRRRSRSPGAQVA